VVRRQVGPNRGAYRFHQLRQAEQDPGPDRLVAKGDEDLLLTDRAHCVHRFHIDQPRASLIVAQPAAVKSLASRFDEIWATGEPGLSSTTLGL
jgi:hypothetical protein